jgi:hypothetical protein
MSIDLSPSALSNMGASPFQGVQAGYGVSLTDLGQFENALQTAQNRVEAAPVSSGFDAMKMVSKPLEFVNHEAAVLQVNAQQAMQGNQSMTPGEMVMLSVQCQEFMFHCQLTSNVANRASDGLQQLFRQQS